MNIQNLDLYRDNDGSLFLLVKEVEPTNVDRIISKVYRLHEENIVKRAVGVSGQETTNLLLAEIGNLSKVSE